MSLSFSTHDCLAGGFIGCNTRWENTTGTQRYVISDFFFIVFNDELPSLKHNEASFVK